jgi:peptidoglycan/LPS O-acetylase OafA/YrhL
MTTEINIQNQVPESKPDVAATKPLISLRNPALDFTKGTLVLTMVLYHWINYFIGPQWGYYYYLRFLTPSFIFITGFMVSNVYLSKYAVADPRLSKRLFIRGLKLLVIFVVLNATRFAVVPMLGTGTLVQHPLDPSNLFAAFVSGNLPVVGGKVAFSILVPIGYLLMLSGVLMLAYRRYPYTFHFVFGLLLITILALGLAGVRSPILEHVTIGMFGLLGGFVPIGAINDFVRHPYALAFAYLCYVVAINFWGIPFLLLLVGVVLSVMIIYLAGTAGSTSSPIRSRTILLGKYSLFGYISQIAILQILSAIFHRVTLGSTGLVISFVAVFALTIASVDLVDRARARVMIVNGLYKAIFA